MNHKILVLNGPPHAGKDLICSIIYKHFNCRQAKFSRPLKDGIKSIFRLNDEIELEAKKDEVTKALFNKLSYRQMQIELSERLLKPLFGSDIFGQLLLRDLQAPTNAAFTVVSDSGFIDELMPLRKQYGIKNIYVLKLTRSGTSYAGDSRGYLDLGIEWQAKTFANELPKASLPRVICLLVSEWLQVRPNTMILDHEPSFEEATSMLG
jgi:hypothetical protein